MEDGASLDGAAGVDQILAYTVLEDGDDEFFVTFKNKSHLHAKWVSGVEILAEGLQGRHKMQRFLRKNPSPVADKDEELFNPDFLTVDRIIAARPQEGPGADGVTLEYLIKWCALPYSNATWELFDDFQDSSAVERFNSFNLCPEVPANPARPAATDWVAYEQSPDYKYGNKLRPWQLEGVNWLCFNWYQRRGCILADEMV